MTEGYNVQLEHSSQESRSTLGDVTLKTVDGVVLSSFPGYQDNRNMRDLSRNADSLVSQAVAKLEAAPLPAPTGGSSNCSGKADCCPEKTAAEKVACCGVGVGVGVGVKYGSSKEEAAVKGDCCAEEAAASKAGCASKKSGCSTHDRSKTGGAVAEATRGCCAGGECCFSSSQLVLIGLMLVVAAGAYHYLTSIHGSSSALPASKVMPDGFDEKMAAAVGEGVAQAVGSVQAAVEEVV